MRDPRRPRSGRVRALWHTELRTLLDDCAVCPWVAAGQETQPWAKAAEAEWGCCGVGYYGDEELLGYLLFCPPLFVPRHCAQSGGLNADAAVVLAFRVKTEPAGPIGRQLAQGALARIARGPKTIRALEVRAARTGGHCDQPAVDLCLDAGFAVVDEHPLSPRLRLELSRTVRWTPPLTGLVDRLVGWTRPLPPEPAGRQPASRVH